MLGNEGYTLLYDPNGIAALKRLETTLPDVILLDLKMPTMDGLEVCQRIKTNYRWRPIPIIMLSELNSRLVLSRCLELGGDDFVDKPINSLELRARVRSMLRVKQQYDELQQAIQLRQDLSDMIVHDLRNPLTSIIIACELLKQTDLQNTQQTKVNQVLAATQRLERLIDNLLTMAELQADKLLLNREAIDLCDLGRQVVADFQPITAQIPLQLISHLPRPGQTVWGDAVLLRRILENLLANAIKFSPKGSPVTLEIDYPGDTIARIKVSDCGFGVKAELKQAIFQKYEIGQVVKGVTQIGLGLAFCKMAIEAHGGQILVEDNQPSGSIFTVILEQAMPA